MLSVVSQRTKHIAVVVQDLFHPHNISACLRSSDAFGIQNIHLVHSGKKFKPSTVARGVDSWVSIKKHPSIDECVHALRKSGFTIAAAQPHPKAVLLREVKVDKPIALVFGNEAEGISDEWSQHVDCEFTIPMVGMVESLNISVSCAIALYEITQRAKNLLGENYFYSQEEQENILCEWICRNTGSWEKQLTLLRERQRP